jgi:hypothetical protein
MMSGQDARSFRFRDEAMFSFLQRVRVALGQGHLDRYTVFEHKRLFGLYVHVFNTVEQDRFHSHAFDAYSLLLRGGYEEEVMADDGTTSKRWVGPGLRFIPKSYNHRLLRSKPNTVSVLLAGPWAKFWTEDFPTFKRILTWGRKEVRRIPRLQQ